MVAKSCTAKKMNETLRFSWDKLQRFSTGESDPATIHSMAICLSSIHTSRASAEMSKPSGFDGSWKVNEMRQLWDHNGHVTWVSPKNIQQLINRV